MTQFDNTNRFVLFKNKEKRDDKDRDYNGTVNIDGKDYWLNGYIKQSDKGAFISCTVRPKDAPQQTISQRAMPRRDSISSGKVNIIPDDMDDSIPF